MVERTERDGDDGVLVAARGRRRATTCAPPAATSRTGDAVFEPGTVLGPAHLGVLASLGLDRGARRIPQARVGVLSTGDELREGPVELAPGQIRDSNRPMLLAMLRGGRVRAGRTSASRATTRRSSTRVFRDAAGALRRGDHERRRLGRRLRRREGGARPARRAAVVAGRDQAGEAVRVRAASTASPLFGLPGQPGELARELRAVRPARAAADDGPRRAAPAGGRRGRRRRDAAPARRQAAPRPRASCATRTAATSRCAAARRRATRSSAHGRGERPRALPDGDGARRAGDDRSDVCSSS